MYDFEENVFTSSRWIEIIPLFSISWKFPSQGSNNCIQFMCTQTVHSSTDE